MKMRLVRVEKIQGQEPAITVEWEGENPHRIDGSVGTFNDGVREIRRYFEVELSTHWQPIPYDPRERNMRDHWEALVSYAEIERGYMTLSCTCVTYSDRLKSFLERLALYP